MVTENSEMEEFKENSQAVQSHLSMLQNVIHRMAGNSSACKTWCITLVSAILVVVADKNKPDYIFISLIPIILFLLLDTYYLAFERGFRESYNVFIKRLHHGGIRSVDLFEMKPGGNFFHYLCSSILSFSVWPFYSSLALTVLIARTYILD